MELQMEEHKQERNLRILNERKSGETRPAQQFNDTNEEHKQDRNLRIFKERCPELTCK
jgi:hypothetical protein